jgi:hypothetical protein
MRKSILILSAVLGAALCQSSLAQEAQITDDVVIQAAKAGPVKDFFQSMGLSTDGLTADKVMAALSKYTAVEKANVLSAIAQVAAQEKAGLPTAASLAQQKFQNANGSTKVATDFMNVTAAASAISAAAAAKGSAPANSCDIASRINGYTAVPQNLRDAAIAAKGSHISMGDCNLNGTKMGVDNMGPQAQTGAVELRALEGSVAAANPGASTETILETDLAIVHAKELNNDTSLNLVNVSADDVKAEAAAYQQLSSTECKIITN